MKKDGYEADKNRIVIIPEIGNSKASAYELHQSSDGEGSWDRSPGSISFLTNETLTLLAEEEGRVCLWTSDVSKGDKHPQKHTQSGSVSEAKPISKSDVLISSTNLVDNSVYSTLSLTSSGKPSRILSSNSDSGKAFGLSPSQFSEFWFKGANKHPVHALVMKPSNFKSSTKYPLAYLIHGGPQGAWNDQWSTRWNPAVFAEQGYVVVCPNPTGSTGYGQAFTDAIHQSWGGLPYDDISAGFEHIKANLPYVDTSRSVALGASYGGYMMNWMQGHPLGREFKAIVTHDGVFSMAGQLASEEQYFPLHDLGGPVWKNQAEWDKWDPSRHTGNWATPNLIIHSELDYRLTMAEGLAAFNVLQMRGVESRFLYFPDENHWVLKPENSLVWHRVVLNWINRFVGLPAAGSENVKMDKEAAPVRGIEELKIFG